MPNDKCYTTGELAKASGLTVRALQHYDNIGLLPPSGHSEGGRRLYSESDMVKLMQITFFKAIGVPLRAICGKLSEASTPSGVKAVFEGQVFLLLRKIDELHSAVAVLNSALEDLNSGKGPEFETLSSLIRSLQGSSLADWAGYRLDPALNAALENSGISTIDGAMGFYHAMRGIFIDAVKLGESGVDPNGPMGLAIGKRWWEGVILKVSPEGEGTIEAALSVYDSRDEWPKADRELFEAAEPFLERALSAYLSENNIKSPLFSLGGETE